MNKPIVITHHELTLNINPTGIKRPVTPRTKISIMDIFDHFKQRNYETKDRKFKDSRFCGLLPIIKISSDKTRIDLMLCLSDKDADNQIVRDFDDIKKTRPLTRSDTEGVDSIVHVVIKFDKKRPAVAHFAIERKVGLTPTFFTDTLNYFLKDICKAYPNDFKGVHPTEKDSKGVPKKLSLKLKFDYSSVLSDEIVKAFENGRVDDVLFHQESNTPDQFDPAGNFVLNKKTVHLDVKGRLVKKGSKTNVEKIRDLGDGFKNIVKSHINLEGTTFTIKFKNESGQNQTAYYDATNNEFSLAKKTYLPESIKIPASQTLELNKVLCDKIFLQIK